MADIIIFIHFQVQDDAGDLHGLSQPTVSRICARVAHAIANKANSFIKMPITIGEQERISAKFRAIKNFPGVIGAIDCTHIKIKKTGGDMAQYYINRKGYYSLNVQVKYILILYSLQQRKICFNNVYNFYFV